MQYLSNSSFAVSHESGAYPIAHNGQEAEYTMDRSITELIQVVETCRKALSPLDCGKKSEDFRELQHSTIAPVCHHNISYLRTASVSGISSFSFSRHQLHRTDIVAFTRFSDGSVHTAAGVGCFSSLPLNGISREDGDNQHSYITTDVGRNRW